MSDAGDSVQLFTPEELAAMAAAAEEAQREFDAWAAQLQTPEAKAEGAILAQEVMETWAAFEQEIAAGEYTLSLDEREQLQRDGILAKCHTIKSGGGPDK